MTSGIDTPNRSIRNLLCIKASLLVWGIATVCCGILLCLFLGAALSQKKNFIANDVTAELNYLAKKLQSKKLGHLTQQQWERHFESLGKRLNLTFIEIRPSNSPVEVRGQAQHGQAQQKLPNIKIELKNKYSHLLSYEHNYLIGNGQQLFISADFSSTYSQYFSYFLLTIVGACFFSLGFGFYLYSRLTHHITHPIKELKKSLNTADGPIDDRTLLKQATNKNTFELFLSVLNFQRTLSDSLRNATALKGDYNFLVNQMPAAIWCIELHPAISLNGLSPKTLCHLINENGVLCHLNDTAETILTEQTKTTASKVKPSWTALPFLNEQLFTQMLEEHLSIKNKLSEFYDHQQRKRAYRNSLFGAEHQGQLLAIWGVALDVSDYLSTLDELEQREKELQLSESRLAQAQALAHMGHWSYETESDNLQVSEEFSRIYGFNPIYEHATWRGLVERMHPEDKKYVIDILSDPESTSVGTEHRIIWPTGEERFVQAIASKVIDNNKVSQSFGIIMDITSRRRAEQQRRVSEKALIESEARMAEAQAIAHMGHWVLDYSNKQLMASDEFFRLHGYEPQEFIPHVRDFTVPIHPDDKPRIREKLKSSQTKAFTEEYRIIRRDGEVRHMRATVTPYYSGGKKTDRVFGISMDVTDQKLAEIELKNSQQQLNKLFQSSPDGIFVFNSANYQLISFNPAFQQMLGLSGEQLIASPLLDLPIWPAPDQVTRLKNKMIRQPSEINFEMRFINSNNQIRIALLSWKPITISNQACILVNMRDITSLRELEDKAKKQELKLLQNEKLASLGTMVAGVAHEVNNPNHLIQMNAELLQDFLKGLTPVLKQHLEQDDDTFISGINLAEVLESFPELLNDIRLSAKRIDRIVKDLKDFARPQENSEFLMCDLNQIAEKTRGAIQPLLLKHDIRLILKLAKDLPPVMGDANRLQQVMENLVSNACEATFKKNAEVTLATRFDADNKLALCEVIDQGCGINKDTLKHIFDPFFTTKQNSGGTGLGLAITHSILQEHKAQFEVESEPSKGTLVRFALAIAEPGITHNRDDE